MEISSDKLKFQCINCKSEYTGKEFLYLCPDCSKTNSNDKPLKGIFKVIYDYKNLRALAEPQSVYKHLRETEFLDLLPIKSTKNLPNLRVGDTPLYKQTAIIGRKLPFNLFLKDDSQNPTFSFKDRASALVSAFAKERNLRTIVAASTGNAGSSLAGICASQGQKAIIIVPESAPLAKLTQIVMYGAQIIPVKGTYDDAFDLSIAATNKFGLYNRNTAYNPLTIEGKKTVSFELFKQLDQKVPDRIFVPVGDGVIISGVYKGFEDLLQLGIIEKIPCIVAVQSDGSDNLIKNINKDKFEIKISNTIADSISVDIPRNFYMAKDFIQKYKGEYLSISDNEILKASKILSEETGLFAEPAAAAAFAAMLKYTEMSKIQAGSNNVVLLTGSGLKDLRSVQSIINIPEAIESNIENLSKLLQ